MPTFRVQSAELLSGATAMRNSCIAEIDASGELAGKPAGPAFEGFLTAVNRCIQGEESASEALARALTTASEAYELAEAANTAGFRG